MRRVVLTILVVALLAGCASGPSGTSQTNPTGSTDGSEARFAAPLDLSGPQGGPEPLVVVGDDGAIWVAAQDAGGGPPHVWVSRNGGKSFTESRPAGVSGGEVDISVGGGVAFVTQLGPGGNVVSYSRDHGATWSQSRFAGTNYFERELVLVDRGSAYLVSRFGITGLTGQPTTTDDASVARSDDGGITFVPAGRAWDADHEPGTTIGNMISFSSGIGMGYNCRDVHAICFARSSDRGASWTQHLIAARNVAVDNVYPIVASSGSRISVVWSDASNGRLAVWGATSADGGVSWSSPAQLSEATETATLPWIGMGGGRTWIAYLSTSVALTDAGSAPAKAAKWYAKAARMGDDLGIQERALVLPDPVHNGLISKPVGNPGNPERDRSFGDFFTIAVTGDGKPLVAVVVTTDGASRDLLVAGT